MSTVPHFTGANALPVESSQNGASEFEPGQRVDTGSHADEAGPVHQQRGAQGPDFKFETGAQWLTYALITAMGLVFVMELALGQTENDRSTLTVRTLLALGGRNSSAVVNSGEWWRMFTAPMLHGSVIHFVLNATVLWIGGNLFERNIGRAWFAAIFFFSCVGGSIGGLLFGAEASVTVGASGGVVGVFAAVLILMFHYPRHPAVRALQLVTVVLIAPSLLPFLDQHLPEFPVEYAGHYGGAVAGALLACLVLLIWPQDKPHPRYPAAAIALVGLYVAVCLYAVVPVAENWDANMGDGFQRYFAGDFKRAAKIFEAHAKQGGETEPYYRLWKFIAQARERDANAIDELSAAAFRQDARQWPYPVFQFYLHRIGSNEMFAKAGDDNQRCEAFFYLGEGRLLSQDITDAVPLLQRARAMCPKTYMEYEGAVGELKTLGAG
ncbi:rhomboid family intramembrane serine protease [Neorhizobium sp. P12A]|uniref:rhomboid family intramembrane serine protease n=1 Tax=Neorhizobium sp. P12A TaxID=2268027 RepID=UPI00165D5C4A|nr:rhomboid family intramembrane serine protease [Neorhizobium sp. P12A]